MAGGVSNVEVQPTHTRRSIMTQMLCHQINGIHGRGEPLTALFATESVIYGRFGYGQDQVIARAFEKGADDYIVKLFLPTELAAGVQAALRRRAGHDGVVGTLCAGRVVHRLCSAAGGRGRQSGTADAHQLGRLIQHNLLR